MEYNAKKRLDQVEDLKKEMCQTFLKMIVTEDWQEVLYKEAERHVVNNSIFKVSYIDIYDKMREKGFDKYSVSDMDMTAMYATIMFVNDAVHSISNPTKTMMGRLKECRNSEAHLTGNEETQELYLLSLLELCELKRFVKCIDVNETWMDNDRRLSFRKMYSPRIDELSAVTDNERFLLLYDEKSFDVVIQQILSIKDEKIQTQRWFQQGEIYRGFWWKDDDNRQKVFDFYIKSSDAGIECAHSAAIDYFFIIKKDYEEAIRRINDWLESLKNKDKKKRNQAVDSIMCDVNFYLGKEDRDSLIEDSLKAIMQRIIDAGYPISVSDSAYEWIK